MHVPLFHSIPGYSTVCDLHRKILCASTGNTGEELQIHLSFTQAEKEFKNIYTPTHPSMNLWRNLEVTNTVIFPEDGTQECNCAVPCNTVIYEPRLSYAQLSSITIESVVLNPKTAAKALEVFVSFLWSSVSFVCMWSEPFFSILQNDSMDLTSQFSSVAQKKYSNALEVAQKSVGKIFDRDKDVISELLKSVQEMPAILEEFQMLMPVLIASNFSQLVNTYPTLTSNPFVVRWFTFP